MSHWRTQETFLCCTKASHVCPARRKCTDIQSGGSCSEVCSDAADCQQGWSFCGCCNNHVSIPARRQNGLPDQRAAHAFAKHFLRPRLPDSIVGRLVGYVELQKGPASTDLDIPSAFRDVLRSKQVIIWVWRRFPLGVPAATSPVAKWMEDAFFFLGSVLLGSSPGRSALQSAE